MDYLSTPPKKPTLESLDKTVKKQYHYRILEDFYQTTVKRDRPSNHSFSTQNSSSQYSDRFIPRFNKEEESIEDLMIDEKEEQYRYLIYSNQKQQIQVENQKFPYFKQEYDYTNSKRYHPKLKYQSDRLFEMAPLKNDFYYNLIDIDGIKDIIGIAYYKSAIIYDLQQKKFDTLKICEKLDERQYTTCIKFCEEQGNQFAISDSQGLVYQWDLVKKKQISLLQRQEKSVRVLNWQNPQILTVAGVGNIIYNLDTRQQNHEVQQFKSGHSGNVCSLKWNTNKSDFITGGVDSQISVWSCHKEYPIYSIKNAHKASIKGLNWSSLKSNNFISGGGIGDGELKLWDYKTQKKLFSVDTKSQVTNLLSPYNEFQGYFMATFGTPTNSVEIWLEQTNSILKKKKDLQGHKFRVLYSAISKYNDRIITSSYDGQMRLWDCFVTKNQQPNLQIDNISQEANQIR